MPLGAFPTPARGVVDVPETGSTDHAVPDGRNSIAVGGLTKDTVESTRRIGPSWFGSVIGLVSALGYG